MNNFIDGPVIVMGMHRSGTSILCKVLSELGLFAGNDQTRKNFESYFFVQINRWFFEQCGASWDRPLCTREMFANEKVYTLCREYVRKILASPFSANYLGKKLPNGIFSVDRVWGWKDPRNTFTLPLWLDLFPNARVLNVTRNGVDVANSLQVREAARLAKREQAVAEGETLCKHGLFRATLEHEKMKKVVLSLRCQTLDGGLALWEEYMDEAQKHIDKLDQQSMNVCYEELLSNPVAVLDEVCNFCGLGVTEELISGAASALKSSRANAYLKNPNLVRFAEENEARLNRF